MDQRIIFTYNANAEAPPNTCGITRAYRILDHSTEHRMHKACYTNFPPTTPGLLL